MHSLPVSRTHEHIGARGPTVAVVAALWFAAAPVFARQDGAPGAPAGAVDPANVNIWELFQQSFDFFTVLLVLASLAAWTFIVAAMIEIRSGRVLPARAEAVIRSLIDQKQWPELRAFVTEDRSFISRVVAAAMNAPGADRDGMREAAELAASEECARWFRKIEPLNVLGNLGPLLGLAGTVWGMVIAFAALGQTGGEASPATLSLGVSKALFHTLLGLLLAVPALTVFGFYRGITDRLCNRAMVVAAELVEMLPVGKESEK